MNSCQMAMSQVMVFYKIPQDRSMSFWSFFFFLIEVSFINNKMNIFKVHHLRTLTHVYTHETTITRRQIVTSKLSLCSFLPLPPTYCSPVAFYISFQQRRLVYIFQSFVCCRVYIFQSYIYILYQFLCFGVSYAWNYAVCGLFCLASFTQHNYLEIHPFYCRYVSIAHSC